jgi:hypothetical protein
MIGIVLRPAVCGSMSTRPFVVGALDVDQALPEVDVLPAERHQPPRRRPA